VASFTSPLAEALAPDVLDRFLRYVRVDTQSKRDRDRSPSTPGQLELSRMLVDELRAAGVEDAELDDNGYVIATLPATVEGDAPVSSSCPATAPCSTPRRCPSCVARRVTTS
jgi:tripeptide aminopeptidase